MAAWILLCVLFVDTSRQLPPATAVLTFAQAFDPRNNAFGFLRLSLAVLVIFSHSYHLGGFGLDPLETLTARSYTIGLMAVAMFFTLSGFLICRSACRSPSVGRFLWHRFLRIYPGYWVSLVVCACVFAPLISLAEAGSLLRVFSAPHNSPREFILQNLSLFHFHDFSIRGIMLIHPDSIGGLLTQNPVPSAINASLWTLPFEVACYVMVAALAALGVLRRARLFVLALFAVFWGLSAVDYVNPDGFWACFPFLGLKPLILLALYFSAGSVCFLFREKIPHSGWLFASSLIALSLALRFGGFGLVAPVTLTYACLWLAFRVPFSRFEKRGDFSYGAYIYAFPIQQGLALLGLQKFGFAAYFATAVLATALLAFLSYRLIEAPCLQWKSLDWLGRFPRPEKRTWPLEGASLGRPSAISSL